MYFLIIHLFIAQKIALHISGGNKECPVWGPELPRLCALPFVNLNYTRPHGEHERAHPSASILIPSPDSTPGPHRACACRAFSWYFLKQLCVPTQECSLATFPDSWRHQWHFGIHARSAQSSLCVLYSTKQTHTRHPSANSGLKLCLFPPVYKRQQLLLQRVTL